VHVRAYLILQTFLEVDVPDVAPFRPANDLLGVRRLNALLDEAFTGWPNGNGSRGIRLAAVG
jgi:hypothetical protein